MVTYSNSIEFNSIQFPLQLFQYHIARPWMLIKLLIRLNSISFIIDFNLNTCGHMFNKNFHGQRFQFSSIQFILI